MTKEKKFELFEKAEKYVNALPAEDRGALRIVGFYDCLVRVQPLVEALEKIANPVKYFQENLKEGERLNGTMAVAISNDPSWLKNEAVKALQDYNKISHE